MHQSKKQKHIVVRINKRLGKEFGFTVGESTTWRIVCDKKGKINENFVPLEFDPYEAAQIDFGTAYAYLKGEKIKFKFFCMRLCYSGHYFVKSYPSENEECFLDAHISALKIFGGVPRRIIFDNDKVAVKEGLSAYVSKENKRYTELKAHYHFSTDYCNPRSGKEKGLVENLAGYVRRNALVPMPKVTSFDELIYQLWNHCQSYINHSIKSRTGTVGENFFLENSVLLPFPLYHYAPEQVSYSRVDSYSLITYQINIYSVPTEYCVKEVHLKVSALKIGIYTRNNLIATHERNFGKCQKIYDIKHCMKFLEAKPRAIFNTAPVKRFIPKEILSEYATKPNGQKLLLAHLKEMNGLKETPDITVIPTQLKLYIPSLPGSFSEVQ